MFCIFNKDVFVNFWGNSKGDKFIESTCKTLRMMENEVDLVWYEGLFEIPAHYEFDASKNLVIKKEVVHIVDVITHDEQGNEVVIQEEQKSLEVDYVIQGEVFFSKGLMIKTC